MTTTDPRTVKSWIRAVNAFTARWCEVLPPSQFALSGVGLWPLLALLQSGATPSVASELETAIGIEQHAALAAAATIIQLVESLSDAGEAIGLWAPTGTAIDPIWRASVPRGVIHEAPVDGAEACAQIDAWVTRCTRGRITSLGLKPPTAGQVLLASAAYAALSWT
jgi:hypothetical protein